MFADLAQARLTQLAQDEAQAQARAEAEAQVAARAAAATRAVRQRTPEQEEDALWVAARDSDSLDGFKRYLARYPQGRYADEARFRRRELIMGDALRGVDLGTYHALVIGIADYKHLPKLRTSLADARAVSDLLERDYGFTVTRLFDASRADIIDALDELRETLAPKDNLLIYYAGHGWLDEDVNRGYWLPRGAKQNRRSRWISNTTITDTLKGLLAKHVMIVADSCFSGTLTRSAGAATAVRNRDYWTRITRKRARLALTSGGLEPVADGDGGVNSPFAKAFLDALGNNDGILDATRLFAQMRRPVILNAQQTPEFSDVRNAGHEGGDFIFVKRR